MPIDDLTALGLKMREARKNKELTQQELSDLSHVSVKQIANIEKGKMNPSYLILRAYTRKREEPLFFPAVALFPSTHQNSHSKSRSRKSGFLVKDFVSFREGINL